LPPALGACKAVYCSDSATNIHKKVR
jgi:hypothetical protein